MTITGCDLCGMECGGQYEQVQLTRIPLAEKCGFSIGMLEVCKDCGNKLDASRGRIRLIIEPEENKTPYQGVKMIRSDAVIAEWRGKP